MDKHSQETFDSQTPEIEESSQEIYESDFSQTSEDSEDYDQELIRSLGKKYRINATHLK